MRALIFCIALTLLSVLPAWAVEVLIVQSTRNAAYGEAVKGFHDGYRGSSRTVILSDYAEVDVVRLVKEERPRLVLAVGDPALTASRKVRQVPVVALMALNLRGPAGNVGGISVLPAPERYMRIFTAAGVSRIGVVFDPARTGLYVQRAKEAARRAGITLVLQEIHRPQETMGRLERLRGSVDALWMLPDSTAVATENVDAFFLLAVEKRLPVVTFAQPYLGKGAVASLDVDYHDLGRQAAEQTTALLNGRQEESSVADARKVRLHVNTGLAQKLGLAAPALERTGADRE